MQEEQNSFAIPNNTPAGGTQIPAVANTNYGGESIMQGPGQPILTKIIITIIALVVVGGGGAFAYIKIFETPEKVLYKSLDKWFELGSMKYVGSILLDATSEELENTMSGARVEATINIGGDYNKIAGDAYWDSSTSFGAQAAIPPFFSFDFEGDVITLDGNRYIKFLELGGIEAFLDLSSVLNQWIKIDNDYSNTTEDIFDLSADPQEEMVIETANIIRQENGLVEFFLKTFNFLPEEINVADELSDEDAQKREEFKKILFNSGFLEIKEELPSDDWDGVSTYHYALDINEQKLAEAIIEASAIMDEEATQVDPVEVRETLSSIDIVPPEAIFEIWIGKWDKYPRRIYFHNGFLTTDTADVSLTMDWTFSDFNVPAVIEAPTEYISMEEAMATVYGSSLKTPLMEAPQNSTGGTDMYQDSDKDGLADNMEGVWGTNPYRSDTDGDGYTDGEEVDNGYNPAGPGKL